MSEIKSKIAVIGAGISGLTCAYELQKLGFEVTVFEKKSYVGGRMSTRTINDLPFDIGANHLAEIYTSMKEYSREFGLEWQKMDFLNYGVYKKDKVMSLDKLCKSLTGLRIFRQIKKPRRIANFFDFSLGAEFDTDNTHDALIEKIGQEGIDYLVDGFTATYDFHLSNELSISVFIAMLDSLYFDGGAWSLRNLKGGMRALPEAFAFRLKDIRLNVEVTRVQRNNSGKFEIETKQGKLTETFDTVVFASTADATARILENPTPAQRELLEKIQYATTVGVAYKVPADLLGQQAIVWVPFKESKYISGYTNEAMKGKDLIDNGKTLLCAWFHDDFAKSIIDKPDHDIFNIAKEHLLKVCPYIKDASVLENYDLQRWPKAMPKFAHGSIRRVKEFIDNHQGENNVFLCGDYLNSPWTEGSIQCGQRVAKAVYERLSTHNNF